MDSNIVGKNLVIHDLAVAYASEKFHEYLSSDRASNNNLEICKTLISYYTYSVYYLSRVSQNLEDT